MKLNKDDIKRIGYAAAPMQGEEGRTSFFCSLETVNIEYLLLRSILDLMGYKIIEERDAYSSTQSKDSDAIELVTDLPWHIYTNL